VRSRTERAVRAPAGRNLCNVALDFGFEQQQTGFNFQADKFARAASSIA
jgi:hemoglobin/transferrin/lactoferrin receptor protein